MRMPEPKVAPPLLRMTVLVMNTRAWPVVLLMTTPCPFGLAAAKL